MLCGLSLTLWPAWTYIMSVLVPRQLSKPSSASWFILNGLKQKKISNTICQHHTVTWLFYEDVSSVLVMLFESSHVMTKFQAVCEHLYLRCRPKEHKLNTETFLRLYCRTVKLVCAILHPLSCCLSMYLLHHQTKQKSCVTNGKSSFLRKASDILV